MKLDLYNKRHITTKLYLCNKQCITMKLEICNKQCAAKKQTYNKQYKTIHFMDDFKNDGFSFHGKIEQMNEYTDVMKE